MFHLELVRKAWDTQTADTILSKYLQYETYILDTNNT